MLDVAAKQTEITEPDVNVRAQLHQEFIRTFSQVRSSLELENHPKFEGYKEAIKRALGTPELILAKQINPTKTREFVRVACWNLERGTHLERIVDELKNHPFLSDHDLLLLTEVDHGMARSGNKHVTRELAEAMGYHAVFAPSHLNFDMGNGPEAHRTQGQNEAALQGHALLSKFSIRDIQLIPLPEPKDLMLGKDERQYGHENALLATVETPLGDLHVVVNHLSARSSRKQRVEQTQCILNALKNRPGPALIGGDWNTHTYNSHNFVRMALGGAHRYVSGIGKTLTCFYPEPNRFHEKKLFQTLKTHGFSYEDFNVLNSATVHYDFTEPEKLIHMRDWLPPWALKLFLRAMESFSGKASLKLDWIAGREIQGRNSRIIFNLPKGSSRISDHDPIMVDVHFQKRGNS